MKRLSIAGLTVLLLFLLFQPALAAVSSYLSVTPSDGIVPKGGSIAFSASWSGTKYLRVQIYKVSNINYLLKDSGWVAGTEYTFDLNGFDTGSYFYVAFARTSSSTQGAISTDDTLLGWEYFYVNGAPFQFEAGTLSVGDSWKTVSLSKTFTKPVVVVKSVEGCDDPSTAKDLCDYLTPRVKNVTSNSFEVMLQAVPKGSSLSAPKNVSYIVVEAGRYKVGGFDIEAGKLNTSNFALLQSNPITATKFYPKFEKEPVVITAITTFNGPDPATTRNKTHYFPIHIGFFTIEIHISDFRDGFVSLIDEPGWDPILEHTNEEISYLAITPGVGELDGKKIYVGEDNVSNIAKTISFQGMFSKKPALIADMQRMYGSDWSIVRHASLTNKSAKLLVAESDGGDHVVEPVGYILVAGAGDTNPISLVANFTATPMQGVPPLDVNFDASGSSNAVSYSWNFGDGSSGSGVKTSHKFENKGTYTVTLTVTDASGNTATAQKDIVVEVKGCESNAGCPCGDGCHDGKCLHSLISINKGQNQVVGFRGKPKDISTTWTLTNTGDHTAFVMGFWTPGCEGQSCEIKLVENGGKVVTPNPGPVPQKPSVPAPTPTLSPTPSVSPTLSPTPVVSPTPSPTPSVSPTPTPAGFSFTDIGVSPNPVPSGGTATFEAVGTGISEIDVKVFDLSGALVFDSGFVPGSTFAWDGKNNAGDKLADGPYVYKITARGAAGVEKTLGPKTVGITSGGSFSFTGIKNVPNPLTGATTTFEAVGTGISEIDVKVFDLSGALVFDSGFVPGSTFAWDGKNSAGEQLANGVYPYKITARSAAGEEKTLGPEKLAILLKAAGKHNGTIFFAGSVKADFTYTYPDPSEPGVQGCFVLDASSSIDPDGKIAQYDWNFSDPNCQPAVDIEHLQWNNPILKHCWCYNCPWQASVPIKLTLKDASGNVLDSITKTVNAVKECGSSPTPSPTASITPTVSPTPAQGTRPSVVINTGQLVRGQSNAITASVSDPDGDARADSVYISVKSPSTASTYSKVYKKKMQCNGTGSSLSCSFTVNVDSSWASDATLAIIAADNVGYGDYALKIVPVTIASNASSTPAVPTPGSTPTPEPSDSTLSPTPSSTPALVPSPPASASGSGTDYNCSNYNFGTEVPLTTALFAIEPGKSVKVVEVVRNVSPPSEKRELSLGFAVHYTDAFGKSNKIARSHTETNIVLANLSAEKFHVKLGLKKQSSCVGWNDLYGATGKGVAPRVLFNWSFNSSDDKPVTINQCDKGNDDFVYCDATQFSIELLKKLHRINELADSNGQGISALTEFRSYLIADNFSEDFRKDFNYYYLHGFFSAPSWLTDSSAPWASYLTDFDRLKFEPAQITESGLYNVRLEFSFEGQEYEFFHDGEPRASIVVKFEKVHPVGVEVVDSPFYHLPFDGLVGTLRVDEDGKKARKDYGLGFVNEDGALKLSYVNGNLVLTSPDSGKTIFRTKKENDFNVLNVNERGRVLSINLSDETMDFSPSYAMPVIMGLQSSNGSAQAFYLPVKGESLVELTAPATFWTGIASSPDLNCKDFIGSALPYRLGDKRADTVQDSCNILEGREHAFGLLWPNALHNGDRLFLKTVFYSAFDDAMKISAACDSVSGVHEVFSSPLGLSSSPNQYIVLQEPGKGIDTFKDLVDRVKNSEVCMASSNGSYVFFWNPEKIEKGLDTAGQRIGAAWSFNWENYKCGSGAASSSQSSDIAADGLNLAYSAPSSLITTDSFSFAQGETLTRSSILQAASTDLADNQVCMSLGELSGSPGFSGGASNGQEDKISYNGTGPASVRLSVICAEGSQLIDTVGSQSSLDQSWAESCSCATNPDLEHQTCCLLALRD